MTNERYEELRAGKAKSIEEATEYGSSEAKKYCETASYEDMAVIADLEPDENGRYEFPEGEELDMEGFSTRVHGAIEAAFVAEVQVFIDGFDEIA